jgi:predicted kinase
LEALTREHDDRGQEWAFYDSGRVTRAAPLVVVVTGLAGSGKTTVAKPLADALDVPLISKDAIKEALFAAVGAGNFDWASLLSRAADAALVRIAAGLEHGVLDNYWRPETVEQLAAAVSAPMVEVFCRVDPGVAADRFLSRVRHGGHGDAERDPGDVRRASVAVAGRFPLKTLGPVVAVDTESAIDAASVAAAVVAAVTQQHNPRPSS